MGWTEPDPWRGHRPRPWAVGSAACAVGLPRACVAAQDRSPACEPALPHRIPGRPRRTPRSPRSRSEPPLSRDWLRGSCARPRSRRCRASARRAAQARVAGARPRPRLLPGPCIADRLESGRRCDHIARGVSKDDLVVHRQDSDRQLVVSYSGSQAMTLAARSGTRNGACRCERGVCPPPSSDADLGVAVGLGEEDEGRLHPSC